MPAWIIGLLTKILSEAITSETIKAAEEEIFVILKEAAAKTATPLDDVIVATLAKAVLGHALALPAA